MLLGFDIGGTKCAVIIGQHSGIEISVIDKVILPTNKPAAETTELLFSAAESILEKNGVVKDNLSGIGISCGGPLNSAAGVILSPPNLPGWDNIPIVALAERRFGKKAVLQNDANACAVAEWKYGAGKGYRNMIFLTFGTGMGAGLILNGSLYSGANDLAGEVGHMRLSGHGPVGFGKAGSFEGYCSGGGIAQLGQIKTREKLQMGETVSFCKSIDELPLLTAKTIADAAYKGDEVAIDIYAATAAYLGKGLAALIDILNPEAIIIGGIYVRAQSLLEPGMRAAIAREALPAAYNSCRILPAALDEGIGDIAALVLADI
jgi:glucokinase